MKYSPVILSRIYENVTEQIMNLIKNNELKPGDKLPPERELAERFAISRGSLREAFRVLESRGLIRSKPGGGRFIREVNKDMIINTKNVILSLEKSAIIELLEAREMFEVKIVELAAQRATDEDVKLIEEALNRVNKKGGRAGRNTANIDKTESETEFHLAIAKASHNFILTNMMRLHFDLLRDTRKRTWQIPGRREDQEEEHKEILEAIKEHDSEKAAKAMLNHLKNIRKIIADV